MTYRSITLRLVPVAMLLAALAPVRAQYDGLEVRETSRPQVISASASAEGRPAQAPRGEVVIDGTSHATANRSGEPGPLAAAGTLNAQALTREGFVVEGPHAFDTAVHLPPPGRLRRFIQKAAVWFSFGLANSRGDRLRLWGPPKGYKLDRVAGADMEALTRPGPNGESPKLRPGDMIVNGANGHAGHLSIYVGDDPKTGRPLIIHSMANSRGQQSYTGQLRNLGKYLGQKVFGGRGKTGVFSEPLGDFFDRYRRDTVMILRDPKLTPEMRKKGVEKIRTLVGRPYDYSLSLQSDDAMYCSEVGVEYLQAAYLDSGKTPPWIGTTWISEGWGPAKIDQWVATPQNFTVSPDLELTWANGAGKLDYVHNHEATVVGSSR